MQGQVNGHGGRARPPSGEDDRDAFGLAGSAGRNSTSSFLPPILEPCLVHARQNGRRLGRPATAAVHAGEIRRLYRAGVSESGIARRLQIGRASVRRTLAVKR